MTSPPGSGRTDTKETCRMRALHKENHLIERIGWLRAAVLGANDGLISTASLIVGVAAASTSRHEVLVAGVAGLVAGAMSMAAGEYVSVSSQADTEEADMARERRELADQPEAELDELTTIYVKRGVEPALARKVAEQMTAKDAFAAHARDELGLAAHVVAQPVQAALTSAATFMVGAAFPLIVAMSGPGWHHSLDGFHRVPRWARSPRRDWCAGRRRRYGDADHSRRILGSHRHDLDGADRLAGGTGGVAHTRASRGGTPDRSRARHCETGAALASSRSGNATRSGGIWWRFVWAADLACSKVPTRSRTGGGTSVSQIGPPDREVLGGAML